MDPILVVEDEPVTAHLVRRVLEREGIACQTTGRGDEAVAWLGDRTFSAVLLDFGLEDGPGWPVLEAARHLAGGPPIVMMTSRNEAWLAAEAVERGASEFWVKGELAWKDLPARLLEVIRRCDEERERDRKADPVLLVERELLERNRLISFQAEVFRALSQHTELSSLLSACLNAIVVHLGVTLARAWTLNPVERVLELQASAGSHTPVSPLFDRIELGQHRVGRVAQTGQAEYCNELESNDWNAQNGVVAFAGFPLTVDDRVEGVLALVSPRPLTYPLPAVLETVARGIAQALARIRSQKELRESQARLARVVDGSNDGYYDWHVPSGLIYFSRRAAEMLDFAELPGDLAGWNELVHPEDRERVLLQRKLCFSGEKPVFELELRMQTAAGEWLWVLVRGKVTSWLGPGRPELMTGTVKDIDQRKRATEILARSNEELRKLWVALEQSPVGVLMTNAQGRIEYANPRFVEMSGYSAAEALGQLPSLVKSGVHTPEFYANLWQTVLSGQVFKAEMCNRRKTGELYWEQDLIAPVRDADGQIVYFIAFQQEITERKAMERQLAESEEKFREVFEAMADGYLSTGLDGALRLANPAAARLLGYSDHEQLPPEVWSEFIRELAASPDARTTVRRRDGELRVFESSDWSRLGPEGRPVSREFVFRDITERVLADEQHQARLAAEEANRLKSQFLAQMSHEIRTPLHAILGMTVLALDTELTERQRRYLENVQQGGEGLLAIVNDILDFSKVEAGKLELERVEFRLDDVLDNVLSVLGPRAEEKRLGLSVQVAPDLPGSWLGDPMRLGQVLINLVGNAIKFTDRGQITVKVDPDGVGGLRFSVSDTGVGLSDEAIEKLFQRFAQADSSTTRKYGGTGLGLAISQHLVHLMGGQIQVQSRPGQGSTFTFAARMEPSDAAQQRLPDLGGLRVLVLENEPAARRTLSSTLRRLGLRVSEQSTAEAALAEVSTAETPFDLTFVSLHLPGRLNSLETVQRLRVESGRTFVIMVAGHGDESVADLAVAAGAHSILFKPFTRSHVLDTVLSLLGCPEPTRPAPRPASAEVLQSLKGARLLVVEDNPINQQIARELLERAGLQVDVVGNGRLAVELLASAGVPCPWQLVLMDLQMPEMDGYTATAAIRRDERFKRLPILAMTAHVLPEERERCYAAGMDDYISKPIDPAVLLSTLSRWIVTPTVLEPTSADFPVLPGVDTLAGMARLAGNSGLYRSLLLELVRQREETCASLLASLGNAEQLRHQAHSLRGAASNLGLLEVSALATELESLARTGQLASAELCVSELRRALDTANEAIRPALEEWTPTDPARSTEMSLESAVERLEQMLLDSDGSSPHACQELRALVPGPELDRLERLIGNFAFTDALAELRGLGLANR